MSIGDGKANEPPGSSYRELVETVPVIFYVADAQGRVLYVSPAFERISGHPPQRLYANPQGWFDFMLPEDRPRVADLVARARGTGHFELEYRVVRADGAVRWLHARSTEIRGSGGALERIVGVATDVTQRRALEEQLRRAQKMEAVGQLAGGVAHDFNNLLTVIVANAGALRQRVGDDEPAASQLAEIEVAAQRAAELTRKMLGFSRQALLSLRPTALGEVARDVGALLRRTLDARIELLVEATPEPDVVVADRAELTHVVLNLCLNARDAMPRGGRMTLATGLAFVDTAHAARVPGAHAGAYAYVAVTDTGDGIPPDVSARMFEPFFTTKPEGKGTGLGLAVAAGIVEQHRGFIECATSPAGSRFTIYLPAYGGPRARVEPAAAPVAAPAAVGSETVLFVDDEEAIRNVARRSLGRQGYDVRLATNGADAVALFAREADAIDLVIVDLTMPRMSGVDVVHVLRAARPDVPIILSTGHIGDEARALEALEDVAVLPKPYTVELLLQTVRRLLDAA
jgi:PAS domain S-box-containing protein